MTPTKKAAKKTVDLVYKLDGNLREIDVFKLAPALIGLGEIIQNAHKTLGTEHEVGVNVRPFDRGSFVVEISLFVKENLPLFALGGTALIAAMSKTTDILATIGMIKGRTESLISAIKKLRGKPEQVTQVGPDEYRYESPNGGVVVNGNVHQLMQNPVIHAGIAYVFANPTEQEGVTRIETYLRSQEQATKITIEKQEASAFAAFSLTALPSPEEIEERTSGPVEYVLKPKRISVEGETSNWSFRFGAEVMHVHIVRDQEFLAKVKSGEYRLSADDLIIAQIIHKQKIRGTELIGEPENELIKVVDYRKAPEHPHLFHQDSGS
ncbi:MAG: hypothetical protein WCC22_06140 [Terriglobales bacterium]